MPSMVESSIWVQACMILIQILRNCTLRLGRGSGVPRSLTPYMPPWADLNASTVSSHPELIKAKCNEIIERDMKQNGFSQFLIDGNNAAPTCYYEAASQT